MRLEWADPRRGISMSRLGFAALCGLFVLVPTLALAEDLAPVALNSLSTAPSLNATQVQDQKGRVLGQAERIQTDQNGKPSALAFRTANGNTIVIAASAVSYDGRMMTVADDEPQIVALTQPQRTAAK
jgi:hypothetical protein